MYYTHSLVLHTAIKNRRRTGVSAELLSEADHADYAPILVPKDQTVRV